MTDINMLPVVLHIVNLTQNQNNYQKNSDNNLLYFNTLYQWKRFVLLFSSLW